METVVATHLRVCPIRSRFIFFFFSKRREMCWRAKWGVSYNHQNPSRDRYKRKRAAIRLCVGEGTRRESSRKSAKHSSNAGHRAHYL